MSDVAIPAPKRVYSSPTLIEYGSMAELTKNGTGSQLENKTSFSKNKRS